MSILRSSLLSLGLIFGAPLAVVAADSSEALLSAVAEACRAPDWAGVEIRVRMSILPRNDPTNRRPPGYPAMTQGEQFAGYSRVLILRSRSDDLAVLIQNADAARRLTTGTPYPSTMPARRAGLLKQAGSSDGYLFVDEMNQAVPSRETVAGASFDAELTKRLGNTLVNNPMVTMTLDRASASAGFSSLNIQNPKFVTEEFVGGRRFSLIEAKIGLNDALVWVDAPNKRIHRVVEWSQSDEARSIVVDTSYLPAGGAAPQWITPNDMQSLFATQEGRRMPAAADFEPLDSLNRRLAERMKKTVENAVAAAPADATAKPDAAAAQPAAPALEAQAMNAEQMAAVVLIEGKDGVGTGYLAEIRGRRFVVTNLHVVGGQDDLKFTTLNGRVLKAGQIFGAMGRDVAIVRLEEADDLPVLKLMENPVAGVKLGDSVVVVGNKRGGGVATQVSGVVRGVGPDRVEVDAKFEPGNSGSPIVHVASGEVIGVAAYSMKRELDDERSSAAKKNAEPKFDERWFGFRTDQITQWEALDMAKWRAQAARITAFSENSEAIYYAISGELDRAAMNPLVRPAVNRFIERYGRTPGGISPAAAQEYRTFMYDLRVLSDNGVKELQTGDFYNYFRTNGYWETSIAEQLAMRAELGRRIDRFKENAAAYSSRLRR